MVFIGRCSHEVAILEEILDLDNAVKAIEDVLGVAAPGLFVRLAIMLETVVCSFEAVYFANALLYEANADEIGDEIAKPNRAKAISFQQILPD